MSKIYVLDTSVLAHDPSAFKSFTNNTVLLPITVLDELDKLKKLPNETGKNARVAIKSLDEISKQGEIFKGIKIENGITLKIDISAYSLGNVDPNYGDNKILACASKIKEKFPKSKVILVAKDINLRVRAKAFGLQAEDYEKDKLFKDDLYSGFRTIKNQDAGILLFDKGELDVDQVPGLEEVLPNEFVLLIGNDNKGISSGRVKNGQLKIVRDKMPWNLKLKNKEQLFASDLILDPKIPLVSVVGKAGSGKTLISMACAFDLVLEKKLYDRLIIYRPIQIIGHDIGFLPGSEQEKLAPYYAPISDAISFLLSDRSKKKDGWKDQLHQYLDNGTIQQEAITYIRGRSIANSLILLDEAQNLSREEIKALITRVGAGSKLIINGDISQIDNSYLDATNNGLTYVVEKFKESELSGHITLSKGERSSLATLASEIL